MTPQPFAYPPVAPRKHGPRGYQNYQEYKDWLRDEFTFRCIYCLEREAWHPARHWVFAVEHLLPQSARPDLSCDYENLAYACMRCNSFKQDFETLDPTRCSLDQHLSIDENGAVIARTQEGRDLIALLHLDEPPVCRVRRAILAIIRLKAAHPGDADVDNLFRAAFAYPENLPDLRAKRPMTNARPNGVNDCHLVRRQEGRLPDLY